MIAAHVVRELNSQEANMKALVLGTVALSLLTGSAALAQRYDSSPRDRYDRDYQYNDFDRDRGRDRDREFRRGERGDRDSRWRIGGTVPYEFRAGGKFVHYDWAGVGLRRPPRGYSWLKIGDSFVLTDDH